MIINNLLSFIREKYHPLWVLRSFAWFRKLQKKLDLAVTIKFGKIRFKVMLLRDLSLVLNKNMLQQRTFSAANKLIKSEKFTHIFDVGANVGLFTWSALSINHNLKIFMFEPDKKNIQLLNHSIRINRFKNISLFEGVIANQNGIVDFHFDDASGATGSIKSFCENRSSLHCQYGISNLAKVKSTTLDSYINMSPQPEKRSILLKIDVEGAEKEVFVGAKNFISKFRPFIIFECFDLKNIESIIPPDYKITPLEENFNYLLSPENEKI